MQLFFHSLVICFLSVSAFFSDVQASTKYERLYFKESLEPDLQDPYKLRPTTLSASLLERIGTQDLSRVDFYQNLLSLPTAAKNTLTDPREKIGDFKVDFRAPLGKGEEGEVYLAQHIETRVFTAVKKMWCSSSGFPDEFFAYKNLNRCFALYAEEIDPLSSSRNRYSYLFIPLIDGLSLDWWNSPIARERLGVSIEQDNSVHYLDLRKNVNLLESIVDELRYCHKRGVVQPEATSTNLMFSYDLEHFFMIDLACSTSSQVNLEDSKYKVTNYKIFLYYALGIRHLVGYNFKNYFLKGTVPQPVSHFHERIQTTNVNAKGSNKLSLAQLAEAVTLLKQETEDYLNSSQKTL